MSGTAVSTAVATVSEISRITVIAVSFVLLILILTTNSWLEPLIILIGLGTAIAINRGTNLIFGEISFVTNAAGTILQLAVSLDYSVFLIHRMSGTESGSRGHHGGRSLQIHQFHRIRRTDYSNRFSGTDLYAF